MKKSRYTEEQVAYALRLAADVGRPASPTSGTCSRSGIESRCGSTFRRYSVSVVASTRALAMFILALIGSGPNAEKNGL